MFKKKFDNRSESELISGRDVAITISPPLRVGKAEDLYLHDCEEIRKIIRLWGSSFILYPEFADGRLHYHGVIHQIDYVRICHNRGSINKIGFAIMKMLPPNGHKNMTFKGPVVDTKRLGWIFYCQKGWRMTTKVLPELLLQGPYISGHRPTRTPIIVKKKGGRIVKVTSIQTLYRLIEEDQSVYNEPFVLPPHIKTNSE